MAVVSSSATVLQIDLNVDASLVVRSLPYDLIASHHSKARLMEPYYFDGTHSSSVLLPDSLTQVLYASVGVRYSKHYPSLDF